MNVELLITNAQDRAECAKILVKAGYRVCQATKQIGFAKKLVLVVDLPEKEVAR